MAGGGCRNRTLGSRHLGKRSMQTRSALCDIRNDTRLIESSNGVIASVSGLANLEYQSLGLQ